MPPWKLALIGAWYHGTLPYRWWRNRMAAAAGRSAAMVLFYHRVADHGPNGWTMTNAQFELQVRWLKDHFDLVSLEETQWRIRSGRNRRASVSITFDDGYADNCNRALPLLIEQRIPCTYFVTSRHVLEGLPFAHDLALGQPHSPNTIEQLREMSRAGIEIGAHTRTHADVGRLTDPEEIYDEVVTARVELQHAIGCTIRYFAYPFGQPANLDRLSYHLARAAGYDGVCSAYGGFNFPEDDAFHLQRIHADPEMVRLKNWLSVDPRKLRTPRFDFGAQEQSCPAAPAR